MEAKRRTLFQQLRHRNVSSIDDLKEKLRKVDSLLFFLLAFDLLS